MQRYFAFYPSRQLALCVAFGHAIAIAALAFVPMFKAAFVLLLIVLILSAIYYVLRDARLLLPGARIAIRLEDERVILFNRNGGELTGRLLRSSVIMPHILILNIALAGHGGKQSVVLMPDSMDAESFRQLRVALKWGVTLAV